MSRVVLTEKHGVDQNDLDLSESLQKHRESRLVRVVWQQKTTKCIDECSSRQQLLELGSDERPDVGRRRSNFRGDLGATINHRDDVFKIVAAADVSPTPRAKGFERRRQKIDRRDDAKLEVGHLHRGGGSERRCIPAIREARDFFARRHDINDQLPVSPPTERSAFTCVFGESE